MNELSKGNILFFTSFNERSIHMESSVLYFKRKGYKVFFLTTCGKGPIHSELLKQDVVCNTIELPQQSGAIYYLKAIKYFVKYCKNNKINFVYSHLQVPNFISSLARLFIKAKVFNVRHNSDVIELDGSRKEMLMERIINKRSSHIIAISDKVKSQLIEKEGVKPKKVLRINNGYDFKDYDKLSLSKEESLRIKEKYKAKFLVVSPGRLIKTKRHNITIEAISKLLDKGIDIKLLILGDGPERIETQAYIDSKGVHDNVYLLGYVENISDYLIAADIVVLLSESEASNNVVKEAGYYEKPVVVCENVGDFSDYIVNENNGFLVSKSNPLGDFVAIIEKVNNNSSYFDGIGKELKTTVLREFNIEEVGRKYEELQNSFNKIN